MKDNHLCYRLVDPLNNTERSYFARLYAQMFRAQVERVPCDGQPEKWTLILSKVQEHNVDASTGEITIKAVTGTNSNLCHNTRYKKMIKTS